MAEPADSGCDGGQRLLNRRLQPERAASSGTTSATERPAMARGAGDANDRMREIMDRRHQRGASGGGSTAGIASPAPDTPRRVGVRSASAGAAHAPSSLLCGPPPAPLAATDLLGGEGASSARDVRAAMCDAFLPKLQSALSGGAADDTPSATAANTAAVPKVR